MSKNDYRIRVLGEFIDIVKNPAPICSNCSLSIFSKHDFFAWKTGEMVCKTCWDREQVRLMGFIRDIVLERNKHIRKAMVSGL